MAGKRKSKPKLEDKEQSRKFVETAQKLGITDKRSFERVLEKLVRQKKTT